MPKTERPSVTPTRIEADTGAIPKLLIVGRQEHSDDDPPRGMRLRDSVVRELESRISGSVSAAIEMAILQLCDELDKSTAPRAVWVADIGR